jgi:uncharacterized membrane protein
VVSLSQSDHEKVSAAIAAAEGKSAGEIVAVATPISDPYHDVALHWAVATMILVLAWAAWQPAWLQWWHGLIFGGWAPEPGLGELLTFLMVLAVLKFTAVLLILRYVPLRMALTPGATKSRARPPPRDRSVQGGRRAPHRQPHRDPHLSVHGRAPRRDRGRRSDPQSHRRRDLG